MANLFGSIVDKLKVIFGFKKENSHNQSIKLKGVKGKVVVAKNVIGAHQHDPREK